MNTKHPSFLLEKLIAGAAVGLALHEAFKEDYPEHDGYQFKVVSEENINFAKIKDDLSYADPVRIVKFNDEIHAVVHHTIYDKYKHSRLSLKKVHDSIVLGHAPIKSKHISHMVSAVRKIKKAQWLVNCQSAPVTGIDVTVIKVDI